MSRSHLKDETLIEETRETRYEAPGGYSPQYYGAYAPQAIDVRVCNYLLYAYLVPRGQSLKTLVPDFEKNLGLREVLNRLNRFRTWDNVTVLLSIGGHTEVGTPVVSGSSSRRRYLGAELDTRRELASQKAG